MTQAVLILLVFTILANIPWFTSRIFCVVPSVKGKSIGIMLVELIVYYFLTMLIGGFFESDFSGEIYSQQWEFYVTTFCLFLVLTTPGIVYRYQWLSLIKTNNFK